jgi:hypothetical protein
MASIDKHLLEYRTSRYILKYHSTFAIIFFAVGLYCQTVMAQRFLEYKSERTLERIEQKINTLISCSNYSNCPAVFNTEDDLLENEKEVKREKTAGVLGKIFITLGVIFLVMGEILRNRKEPLV